MRLIITGAFVISFTFHSGCGPSSAEAEPHAAEPPPKAVHQADAAADSAPKRTPEEAVDAMIALAERGDWRTFVDTYYGEAHKFRSDADRDTLVERFETRYGSRMLEGLRSIDDDTAHITDDRRALFGDPDNPTFILFLDDEGEWTFHL